MVFISRGRGRGGNRGRGRGVGEVSFESRNAHGHPVGRDSRQGPESLRITVGNDQFRDRNDGNISGRLSPSVSQRLGPPKENYDHGREAGYRREDEMYKREADLYGHPERDRVEQGREHDRRDPYSRDPYARPEERDYGDRRGLGGGAYEQPPADYRPPPSQPLFPSGSRPSPQRGYPPPQPAAPSPAQTSTSSRPLKSILKKKPDPVQEEKPPGKPSGLPGIANYMDDIEDEDKFLYGGDDDRRNSGERDRRESGQYRQQPHGVPIEDMRATNIRSAAQSWQPSAPEKTVSGVISDFVNAQREYVDSSKAQQYGGGDPYHSQQVQSAGPMADSGGNDLWSMLAKSVQTVQQQQPPPNQFEPQLGSYQPPFNAPTAQQSFPLQPVQEAQEPAAPHDPTIENILKSIGFDFEMSKRMQEKAKHTSGEVVPQAAKPGDPKFIDHTASFIGSQMSHEDMVSTLGTLQRERDAQANVERQSEVNRDNYRERERDMFNERDQRDGSEASRGRINSPPRRMNSPPRRMDSPPRRLNSPPRRMHSPQRRLSSPPRGQSPEQLQRGCSPVSAEGSPPPPMFNLPPITIKRRQNLDRSRSPGWDKKRSLSRSPTRDSDRSRNRPRSKSPSWSFGRKRSRSPVRKQSLSPVSPISQGDRSRSPGGRKSPIIKRTFNLDDLSPAFRRRVSPGARKRSNSPGRRRSPGRRSSSRRRSISPSRRRSISPGRRRSRSPFRRRSPMGRRSSRSPGRRSPRRRSPSPRGRRRSISPRGRKRGPSSRSRSRERKVRRSTSRDRPFRGSPGRIRRSSSRDRSRRRSRSQSRELNRSPRKGSRSVSMSSDSDIDGPANKQYFSSPLRLPRGQKQNIPRYYDFPPPQGPPPDFNAPPFPGYGPGPGPPPGAFPPGSQPGMMPVGPPGPPMFTVPPPGMGPPMGPPQVFPFPPPGGLPGPVYAIPGPPNLNQPPPITPEPDMAPPGTIEMPLNIPVRSNLTEIVSDDNLRQDSERRVEEKRRERSRSRERRDRSRSREKRDRSRSRERRDRSRSRERRDRSRSRDRRDRSRSRERSKDKRDERKNEKSGSSSNRTVLPPKPRPKAEDIEIKASTTSNERVVVVGGKTTKLSLAALKEEKKEDPEKEKTKILKEKEGMVAKIKALETEFNNLKKQEFDLRKRSGKDSKPDPILIENKKLLDEIKKEIVKLNKQKNDFESRHSALLKREQTTKREVKVTAKKTPSKDEKAKAGDKKEKEEFKVEKGKLMKHYFYDSGDHWCKACNSIHPNIQDFIHHLASYKHKQTLPSDFRPWMDGYKANDGMIINKKGIRVPLPGIEFMMPVTAYYCQLCKVFLGDVSFGADHFKCESHHINYKKYLAENPFYEKMMKEERDKVLHINKASKKIEQEKKVQATKEQTKQTNTEKDARVRANEKKWNKSVEDLEDISSGSKTQERNKSQIKLSLKDQNQKSESGEKGFGKFNWSKEKKGEEQKNGEKTPEATQEKGKINFNISLGGKTLVGKTGGQKKNPLLPPWQPVGKKTEAQGKPGETAKLDQFLTTNSGEGKIPVISEKKKISAKEILEAFSGKYKDKEVPTVLREADQAKATIKKKEDKVNEKQPVKTQQEINEEKDKAMMGIDPESEVPLAEKIPPPPVSQNVPLPNQKPSATVDETDVHKVFNSEKTDENEKPILETVAVSEIALPSSKAENIPKSEREKETEPAKENSPEKMVDSEKSEASDVKSDVVEQKVDLKVETVSFLESDKVIEVKTNIEIELETEQIEPKVEDNVVIKEVENEHKIETPETEAVMKVDNIEIIAQETAPEVKTEIKESVPMEIEDEKKQLHDSENVGDKNNSVVDVNNEQASEKVFIEGDSNKMETKTDDSDTEIDEPVSPITTTRGRGRGRGRKRGGGRGRGRGKAKTTPSRATRSTRSAKAEIVPEETVESEKTSSDFDKVDTSETIDNNETNKDLELNSSVQVAKTTGGKNKKSTSPRIRKTSIKSDSAKADLEEVSDKEDAQSETSGVSMHMDSDFEVVDDLEDMEVLDETS